MQSMSFTPESFAHADPLRLGRVFVALGMLWNVCQAQTAATSESAGPDLVPAQNYQAVEPRIYSVILPGRYVQSPSIEAQVIGTNLAQVEAMTIIMDDAFASKGRLTPKHLENIQELDWMPFQETLGIDLGQAEGERQLWFGFKSSSGKQTWQRYRIDVDRTPPNLTVSNPQEPVVAEPVIQFTGMSSEQLALISLDLANAEGTAVNQAVSITRRVFDEQQRKLAATEFHCYDLHLAKGTNQITVHATDLAGNKATQDFLVVLDPSVDAKAPEITIDWPKPEEEVNARTFRLRGRVNEPTAKVEVLGVGLAPVEGLVERDGLFWVPDLPLPFELNEFTVQSTDYAGNMASKTILIKRSPVEITFDAMPEGERKKKSPTITGTVSDPNCTVWVNGVRAELKGNRWRVEKVPINPDSGTAVFQATAIPNSINGGRGYSSDRSPSLKDMGNPRLSPVSRDND